MTQGVYVHKPLSKETRRKIGNAHRGMKRTDATRRRISIALLGRLPSMSMLGKTHSIKTRKKLSIAAKLQFKLYGHPMQGYHHSEKTKKLLSTDNPGYSSVHSWLELKFGKADRCESRKCSEVSKIYNWTLLRGRKHERKRKNYRRLCISCHRKYDGKNYKLHNT